MLAPYLLYPPPPRPRVLQEIRLVNSQQGEKNIVLRLKMAYTTQGRTVEETTQVSSFPPLY